MQDIFIRVLTALLVSTLDGTAPGPISRPITSADTPLEMSKIRVPRMKGLRILVILLVVRFDLRLRVEGIVIRDTEALYYREDRNDWLDQVRAFG
jgi:hypothetical protein